MTTEADLLRAVLDRPLCDAPRRILADWYDDHDGEMTCPACEKKPDEAYLPPGMMFVGWGHGWQPCSECHGSARVPNGYAARAEFIRCQVELAGLGCRVADAAGGTWFHDCRRDNYGTRVAALSGFPCEPLRRRERELWNYGMPGTWVDRIEPPFECIQCVESETISRERAREPILVYRRGFVGELRVPTLAVLLGGECENCGGTGRVDGDRYEQSEPCPDCGGEYGPSDEDNPSGVEPGTGRAPGIAATVFKSHPVTRVVVADREPLANGEGADSRWSWWNIDPRPDTDQGPHPPSNLPPDVFARLPGEAIDGYYKEYTSEAAALDALSAALVDHCRGLVGLDLIYANKEKQDA